MNDNKSVDINIPNNYQKGKGPDQNHWSGPKGQLFKHAFLPLLIMLVGIGGFGGFKLYAIEKAREPVTIEYPVEATSTISSTTPTRGLGTPSKLGGVGQLAGAGTSTATTTKPRTGTYEASRGGTTYYLPTCSGAKRISDKNKIWFDTKAEAEKFGYKPAKNCKGL